MKCCCLNCEIRGVVVDATLEYKDEYGSRIPLCAECYAELKEEFFAPHTEKEIDE
jgi:hypothetical protein